MEKTAGDGVLYCHHNRIGLNLEQVLEGVALYDSHVTPGLTGCLIKQTGCLFMEAALISLDGDGLH